jgi:type IV secretory pathway TraG/TraD family ATPase VirD4
MGRLKKALAYIFRDSSSEPQAGSRLLGYRGTSAVMVSTKALRTHAYIVGASGEGKSRLFQLLIQQDIENGHGLCVVDPHGTLYSQLMGYLASLPRDHPALKRVVLVDPSNDDWSVGFNPLEVKHEKDLYPTVLEMITVFQKLWADSWGARMEDIMRNSFITLAEHGLTLVEMSRLLTDTAYRDSLVRDLRHAEAKGYWLNRFAPLSATKKTEWVESTLNKVSAFVSDPYIRDMVGQRRSTIDLRALMDEGACVLINLSKGRLKSNSTLIGALLVSKLQDAALSRVDIPEVDRRPFRVYVDEFQDYATRSFEEILSEMRKYGISLMMANQSLAQIHPTLLSSVTANAAVQIYFNCNREDATRLAGEAFRATGKRIKFQFNDGGGIVPEPRTTPVFVSVSEEMEEYINFLLDLGHREALLSIKGEGQPTAFRTADVPDYRPTAASAALYETLLSKHARRRDEVLREIEERRNVEQEFNPDNFWIKDDEKPQS